MCNAKIRPFPRGNHTELKCEKETSDHVRHMSMLRDYAYPGSATSIFWFEDDRRNFEGDWPGYCSDSCILPKDHYGDHAAD